VDIVFAHLEVSGMIKVHWYPNPKSVGALRVFTVLGGQKVDLKRRELYAQPPFVIFYHVWRDHRRLSVTVYKDGSVSSIKPHHYDLAVPYETDSEAIVYEGIADHLESPDALGGVTITVHVPGGLIQIRTEK
jgi:hypothetical protein